MLEEKWRAAAHQAWTLGEILLLEYDGRLTLVVPGTALSVELALEAVRRLAKAVGAPARAGSPSPSASEAPAPGLGWRGGQGDRAARCNPASGKGQGSAHAAIAEPRLRDAGFRVRRLQGRDGDEARDLARQAVDDGVETLVVVGGDGLVHLALQAVAHSETALGIIPSGTGNDAARYFGIPRKRPPGGRRRGGRPAGPGPSTWRGRARRTSSACCPPASTRSSTSAPTG